MKVCITSLGRDLYSEIDLRFGRCNFFIFVDTDSMQYDAIENPWKEAQQGAGIQAAQMVINKGVKKLITGKVGPSAERVLIKAGIIIIYSTGKIMDAIKKL